MGKKEIKVIQGTPPGRTFKRILTGEYFGYKDIHIDASKQQKAKEKILDQINELELNPMYIHYNYNNSIISHAHIVFQKEILAKKWNMLHVTEISFLLYASDFKQFEEMSQLNLNDDFTNLTPITNSTYIVKERRKIPRN